MLGVDGKATNHSTVTEVRRRSKRPATETHTQIHKLAVKLTLRHVNHELNCQIPAKANSPELKTDTVITCGSLWAFLLAHMHKHIHTEGAHR